MSIRDRRSKAFSDMLILHLRRSFARSLRPPVTSINLISKLVGYLYGSTPVMHKKITIPREKMSAGPPRKIFFSGFLLFTHEDIVEFDLSEEYVSGAM